MDTISQVSAGSSSSVFHPFTNHRNVPVIDMTQFSPFVYRNNTVNNNNAPAPAPTMNARSSDSKGCKHCSYPHKNVSTGCPPCNGGKGSKGKGDGGKGPPKGNGDGGGGKGPPKGNGDGDKGPPKGNGDGGKGPPKGNGDGDNRKDRCDPSGSNSSPPPGGGGPWDYIEHIPVDIANNLFYSVLGCVLFVLLVVIFCRGRPSSSVCFGALKAKCRPCKINEKLQSNLVGNKGSCGADTSGEGSLSPRLQEQLDNFKKSVTSQACMAGDSMKCPGLPNYAGVLSGARVISIRDTQHAQNMFMCKCKDPDKRGQHCIPKSGPCSICKCAEAKADLIIQEDGSIVPGKCWAFSGPGKVLIGLFYPVIVTGVTLHHPERSQLIPGYFSSAPKTFEVWGYHNETDKNPFHYGTFQYSEKDPSAKLYEVQKFTTDFYESVQFNFIDNHGNKNYTAVYRVEVHGIVDEK
ncbi:unnamed protein product [Orchesella dallaii]|uniref:SUN domain-containing protein n=1 Tax=Orchesella dallaii TaxID=48710 RepID=A0ABP1Q4Q5_9HEXA